MTVHAPLAKKLADKHRIDAANYDRCLAAIEEGMEIYTQESFLMQVEAVNKAIERCAQEADGVRHEGPRSDFTDGQNETVRLIASLIRALKSEQESERAAPQEEQ